MDLLILAGGMGSRFGGLKQIEPVHKNGEFIIDYSIYDAIKAGFDRVVFLIKEETYDIFRETIGKRVEKHIKTEYVFQKLNDLPEGFTTIEGREKPWGTAHAIWCCRDVIKGKFAIINADDFYGRDAFITIGKALAENADSKTYLGVGYKVKNTITDNGAVKRGIMSVDGNGYLIDINESSIERKEDGKIYATYLKGGESFVIGEDMPVSMNVWGFDSKIFDVLHRKLVEFLNNLDNPLKDEYLIPDVINEQLHDNEINAKILNTSAVWYGVTYREDKPSVVNAINKMVEQGEYPDKLFN